MLLCTSIQLKSIFSGTSRGMYPVFDGEPGAVPIIVQARAFGQSGAIVAVTFALGIMFVMILSTVRSVLMDGDPWESHVSYS